MMFSEKLSATRRPAASRWSLLLAFAAVGLAMAMALSIVLAGDAEAKEKDRDKDPKGNEIASGELLVTYKRDASEQAKDEAPRKVSGQLEEDFSEIKVQHLSFPEVKNERAQEARQRALQQKKEDLERDPAVEAVDYNYSREGSYVPNDPHYSYQWGYPKIKAPEAWDITQGSSTVKVAILDSGIDNNHTDLKGKVVAQKDLVNGDADASDDHGHGTHVAGTVAASTNNSTGVAGTCSNCSLQIVKVLDQNNQGWDSTLIAAINWSANSGVQVINMSLGGYPHSSGLETATNYAWNKGAVLVGASGNNGTSSAEFYPAAYDNVIAVAATDKDDTRASFSNAGDWVDVAAPGVDIYSTLPSEWVEVQDFFGVKHWKLRPRYGYFSGTSMATPHVAGLAALIRSNNEGLYNEGVRDRIEATTSDLGTSGKDSVFGHGRIDAYAALNDDYLEIPIDATAPTVSSVSPSSGKTGVGRSTNVTATFSEAIDSATLTSSSFKLVKKGTTTPISATLTLSSDGKTATLNPYGSSTTNLRRCTGYTATVTTGVKDQASNPLAANKVWSFKTRGC